MDDSSHQQQDRRRLGLRVSVRSARQALEKQVSQYREIVVASENGTSGGLSRLVRDLDQWHVYNVTLLAELFSGPIENEYFGDKFGISSITLPSIEHRFGSLIWEGDLRQSQLVSLLNRLEIWDLADSGARESVGSAVFLVHGRDDAVKNAVARFLEQELGLKVVILHEVASRSKTIIEKLEFYAASARFAVVLITPDDEGRLIGSGDELEPRARQNVILELGYFIAKLGRGNVAALLEGPVKQPSDVDGVIYIPRIGNWKTELVRELKAAGLAVAL